MGIRHSRFFSKKFGFQGLVTLTGGFRGERRRHIFCHRLLCEYRVNLDRETFQGDISFQKGVTFRLKVSFVSSKKRNSYCRLFDEPMTLTVEASSRCLYRKTFFVR